jgi:hypothetical protein
MIRTMPTWTATTWLVAALMAPLGSFLKAQAQVILTMQAPAVAPGEVTILSLTVDQAAEVAGADFVISGPDYVLPGSAETTPATSDFLVASRSEPGRIQIAMARAEELGLNQAAILRIPLTISRSAPVGPFSLSAESVHFYSAAPAALPSHALPGTVEVVSSPADADGDGMPDAWELRYFGTTEAAPDLDADHDGLSNLQEFRAGTDPTSPGSAFRILGSQRLDGPTGAGLWLLWQAQEGRNYVIEWSDGPIGPNMVWWQVSDPDLHIQGPFISWFDDGIQTHAPPSVVSERYYRLVVLPGSP